VAKLSELNPSLQRKILAYGEPGSGKTVFALDFPGPIYVFDFDGKIGSGASFYAGDTKRLESIEYDSYVPTGADDRPAQRFETKLRELERLSVEGKFPYATVVLDSFTTFGDAYMKDVLYANPSIQRTRSPTTVIPAMLDYRIQNIGIKAILTRLLGLKANVLVLAHIKIEKDELTGRIERLPNAPGGLAVHLPVVFEEVYRTYVEVKNGERRYAAQTQADDAFPKVRTQIRGLPAVIALKAESLNKT
jgi:hypothetical protein